MIGAALAVIAVIIAVLAIVRSYTVAVDGPVIVLIIALIALVFVAVRRFGRAR